MKRNSSCTKIKHGVVTILMKCCNLFEKDYILSLYFHYERHLFVKYGLHGFPYLFGLRLFSSMQIRVLHDTTYNCYDTVHPYLVVVLQPSRSFTKCEMMTRQRVNSLSIIFTLLMRSTNRGIMSRATQGPLS
jgi:hypothetical protein